MNAHYYYVLADIKLFKIVKKNIVDCDYFTDIDYFQTIMTKQFAGMFCVI